MFLRTSVVPDTPAFEQSQELISNSFTGLFHLPQWTFSDLILLDSLTLNLLILDFFTIPFVDYNSGLFFVFFFFLVILAVTA